MKTTIELPDALMHRAKIAAAQERTTLKQLMIEGLEQRLATAPPSKPFKLTPAQSEIFEICELGYPVLKKGRGGVMTNEMVNQLREELGV